MPPAAARATTVAERRGIGGYVEASAAGAGDTDFYWVTSDDSTPVCGPRSARAVSPWRQLPQPQALARRASFRRGVEARAHPQPRSRPLEAPHLVLLALPALAHRALAFLALALAPATQSVRQTI